MWASQEYIKDLDGLKKNEKRLLKPKKPYQRDSPDEISMVSEKNRPQRAERTFWSFKLDIQAQIRSVMILLYQIYVKELDIRITTSSVKVFFYCDYLFFNSKQCIVHA